MNSHIELVKRWLAGEDVTTKELKANSIAADAAVAAAYAAYAYAAAKVAAGSAAGHVADLVKRYEELNK